MSGRHRDVISRGYELVGLIGTVGGLHKGLQQKDAISAIAAEEEHTVPPVSTIAVTEYSNKS